MNIGRQTGIQDCGLFTIAFMNSLAHGQNPTDVKYIHLRIHLVKCFESKEMTPFPTTKFKRTVQNKVQKTETIVPDGSCDGVQSGVIL